MRLIRILFLLLPFFAQAQSEGGFGFMRFATTAAMNATSVNNSCKSCSRRALAYDTGYYYYWNGSAWVREQLYYTGYEGVLTQGDSILLGANDSLTIPIYSDRWFNFPTDTNSLILRGSRSMDDLSDPPYIKLENKINDGDPYGARIQFVDSVGSTLGGRMDIGTSFNGGFIASNNYLVVSADTFYWTINRLTAPDVIDSTHVIPQGLRGTDINQMSATTGQALVWDGTSWNPGTVATTVGIDTFEINSNTLYLSLDGDGEPAKTVDLSSYLDNTDSQTISLDSTIVGTDERFELSITGGNTIYFDIPQGSNQIVDTFDISNDSLRISLSNDNLPMSKVDLSGYLDNTDSQQLTIDSTIVGDLERFAISIDSGNTVYFDIPVFTDTSGYNLSLDVVNDTLYLVDGNSTLSAGLADYLDNTDTSGYNQSLSISGDSLFLTDGNSTLFVELDPYLDNTDAQTLTIDSTSITNGQNFEISISNGNTIGLFVPSVVTNTNIYNSSGNILADTVRVVNLDSTSVLNFNYPNSTTSISIHAGDDSIGVNGYVYMSSPDSTTLKLDDVDGFKVYTPLIAEIEFGDDQDSQYFSVHNTSSTGNLYISSESIGFTSNDIAQEVAGTLELDTFGRAVISSAVGGGNFGSVGFYQTQGEGLYVLNHGNLPNPGQLLVAQTDQTFEFADIDTLIPASFGYNIYNASGNILADTIREVNLDSTATLHFNYPTGGYAIEIYAGDDSTAVDGLVNINSPDGQSALAITDQAVTMANASSSSDILVSDSGVRIRPNGSTGTAGQILASDGSFVYWKDSLNTTGWDTDVSNDLDGSGATNQVAVWSDANTLTGYNSMVYETNTLSFYPTSNDTVFSIHTPAGRNFGLRTFTDPLNGTTDAVEIGGLSGNTRVYMTGYEWIPKMNFRQYGGTAGIAFAGSTGSLYLNTNGDYYSATLAGDNQLTNRNVSFYFASGGTNKGNPVIFQQAFAGNDTLNNGFEFISRNTASGGITHPDSTLMRFTSWDRGIQFNQLQDGKLGLQIRHPLYSLDINDVDGVRLPRGNTGERPAGTPAGVLRFNTDSLGLEYADGSQWILIAGGSGAADGNGIYSNNGSTLSGGTTVDVSGDSPLILSTNTGAAQDDKMFRLVTDYAADDTHTYYIGMVSPADSFLISSYDYGTVLEYFGSVGQGLSVTSTTMINLSADSIILSAPPTKSVLNSITGMYGNTLSDVVGTGSGDILAWNTGGYWEVVSAPTGADGNGIYSASGNIASAVTATIASSSFFTIDYNNSNPALTITDAGAITLTSDGTASIQLNYPSSSGIIIDPVNNATSVFSENGSQYITVSDDEVSELIVAAPSTDHTASGTKITLTANENQNFGDVCYIDSDGEAHLADASVIATAGAVVMCMETVTTGNPATYLMVGVARDDTWAWTVGGLIYLSTTGTTGNTLTQTAPSATNEVVQVIGVAIHADRMTFNPNLSMIEIQ